MTTEEMRKRLRITGDALDAEIAAKVAVADAELARVGVDVTNTEPKAAALLDYARELFCKAELNFDGRGERYMAQFESVRDAMKLTTALMESGERSTESGDNDAGAGTQEAVDGTQEAVDGTQEAVDGAQEAVDGAQEAVDGAQEAGAGSQSAGTEQAGGTE